MAMNLSSGASGGRRRGGRRSGRRAPMSEINVTPFVDVMLVLLIIFMVTAPLLNTGVAIDLPESRAEALDSEEEPVEISVDKEGVIYVDGAETPPSALPGRLEAMAEAQDPANPRQILLRGDTSVNYGRIMTVMGELNRAGLNSVSMVTNPVTNSAAVQGEEEE